RSFERIARSGEWQGAVGENIDYGGGDVRAIVVRLIIDKGVAGRKHRANIFNKTYRVAGIAAGPHARYGAMRVMDFAGDFIERGDGIAAR
ncbi:MAG: CAP domain-containing protein, partial [Chthoniobacteraceae bacterium]